MDLSLRRDQMNITFSHFSTIMGSCTKYGNLICANFECEELWHYLIYWNNK